MPTPLSLADGKELVRLCETGRLYEIEAWIQAGKSLTVPSEVRNKPLTVAISTGFHSLVQLLLRHEESQEAKNDALRLAVRLRRRIFVDLAIAYDSVNGTGFVGGLIPREDGAHGPTQQVLT